MVEQREQRGTHASSWHVSGDEEEKKNSILVVIIRTLYVQSEPGKVWVQSPPLPHTFHMTWDKVFIYHVLTFSLQVWGRGKF